MIAKVICTDAIRQRPAIRERTSRSASSRGLARRSARPARAERPIVLPSRMPLTDSDSSTSARHVGQRPWRCGGDPLALAADAAGQPDEERQQREARRRPGASRAANIATIVASTVVTLETIDVAVRGDDVLHAADVVGDARLHLAGARAGEEGERQALQVAVDGGAQVVHDALADDVGQPRLRHAEDAGGDRDARSSRRRASVSSVVSRSGIAVSRTSRSRNGETIPSAAPRRRSAPSTAPSRPR